jgi:PPOX class probable F420-dependent enzyme
VVVNIPSGRVALLGTAAGGDVATDEVEDRAIPEQVLAMFDGRLRHGQMATIRPDGYPAIVPIGIMIHDGKLKISTRTATKKIKNLESDPRISVCIVHPEDRNHYVTIRGTAEVSNDTNREFVDWLARTHMGRPEYPFEPRDIARSVITLHPQWFVMRTRIGDESERRWSI